jgi:hypothetical protein
MDELQAFSEVFLNAIQVYRLVYVCQAGDIKTGLIHQTTAVK